MKRKEYAKKKRERVPVSNAFDRDGAFVELEEVQAFTKFQIAFVVKIYSKTFVTQNEPPMLNIIGRVQNFRTSSINVHRQLVPRRCNLGLNPLLQLCKERATIRDGKKKQTIKEKFEEVHVPKKKLC